MATQRYKRHPAKFLMMGMYAPSIAEYLRYFEPKDLLII